jgi:hypothetical protein
MVMPGRPLPAQIPATTVANQAAPALPPDLALIPPQAVAWGHVQVAAIWNHEKLNHLREIVLKAGPEALQRLDTLFVPKISTLERISFCVLMEQLEEEGLIGSPHPFFIFRFREPFDPKEVVRAYFPDAVTVNLEGGQTVYRDENMREIELWFPDRQHVVIGSREKMSLLWKRAEGKDNLWLPVLRQAERNHVTVALNVAALPIPDEVRRGAPPQLVPFLKVQTLVGTVRLTDKISLGLTAEFGTAAAAQEAEKALQALCDLGRQQLAILAKEAEQQLFHPNRKPPRPLAELPESVGAVLMLGVLKTIDEWLAKPQDWVKREDSRLLTRIELEDLNFMASAVSIGMGLMLPAVQKVREAAGGARSQNNLKQIGLACHNFHDTFEHFPQDIVDKNGKPLLSWRVAILPFVDELKLYEQFKLNEPWNSEHNIKLLAQMPKIYESPSLPPLPGMTYYKGFSGPGAVFETGKKIRIAQITDGSSNTILAIEAGPAVPWTKPEDFPFDPKKPLPEFVPLPQGTRTNILLCDGSVRTVDLKKLGEKKLRLLIQRDDGQPVEIDD